MSPELHGIDRFCSVSLCSSAPLAHKAARISRLVERYRDVRGKSRQRQIAQLRRADELTEDKVQSIIRGFLQTSPGFPPHPP